MIEDMVGLWQQKWKEILLYKKLLWNRMENKCAYDNGGLKLQTKKGFKLEKNVIYI